MSSPGHVIRRRRNMKQTQRIPETFLGVGYTRDRAGLPLEAVRVPVPQPAADQVLIRVAASSLNPLEYKLADLNFMGRTPPVVLGLDLAGVVVAVGHGVSGVADGDAVAAMADLNGDGDWVATSGSGGEGGYAVARQSAALLLRTRHARERGAGLSPARDGSGDGVGDAGTCGPARQPDHRQHR